jgi:hypothetical protein
MKCKLDLYIPGDAILNSHRRENLTSYEGKDNFGVPISAFIALEANFLTAIRGNADLFYVPRLPSPL